MAHSRNHGGSISSAGSLSWSDYSFGGSEGLKTPPPCSPRAGSPASFCWDDSPCSTSSQSSIEEDYAPLSTEAALALKRLDLDPHWGTPVSPNSEECCFTLQAASPSPKNKMKKRPTHLKMDFTSVRKFEAPGSTHSPATAKMINAPLIGCLPTPSPTTLNFNITPRPGLVSRFSDESSSASSSPINDKSLPFSSSNPNSARAATQNMLNSSWPSPGPITPRTVDALDSFGITSNVSSVLMRRAGSRDKPSPLSRSPEHTRSLAKSPLGMPIMTRHRAASSPLVDAKSAQALYHSLLPGSESEFQEELAHTPPALNTPFEWMYEDDTTMAPATNGAHQRSTSVPEKHFNPYFMTALNSQ